MARLDARPFREDRIGQPLSVIFGAGNVGRGFLAQLFTESGYRVVFVDVVAPLLEALNRRGSYTLQLVTDEEVTAYEIAGVSGVMATDREAVADTLAQADLAATAVGVGALPKIAPVVAAGIEKRRLTGRAGALNIIVCENLKDAPLVFAEMLRPHLSAEGQQYLEERVGLVDAVIGRMVPIVPEELSKQDPSLVMAEPYKVLPVNRARFKGSIPAVVGMQAKDNFAAYVDQKLYTHNAGHAVLAYLGYLRRYAYGYEALEDRLILAMVRQALRESSGALAARHGIDPAEQQIHVADLLQRFHNRRLGDTVFRLGRDPLRKLAAKDRLVGAASLVLDTGGRPDALAWGIAAALCFDPDGDPSAAKLQSMLAAQPVAAVLQAVSGLAPRSALTAMVAERYEALAAAR
ncbi:MAG: mannitol dehydrogenase family protein [Anaerolineae bacterium]